MSQVNVINVIAHNAKAPFLSKISFEIFFEALQPLSKSKSIQKFAIVLYEIFKYFNIKFRKNLRNTLAW